MDQEFEAMRRLVCAYYYPYDEMLQGWPDDANALRLLRDVGNRVGRSVRVQINPVGANNEGLYDAWVDDGKEYDSNCASTLSEAAIRCAYAMIGEGGDNE